MLARFVQGCESTAAEQLRFWLATQWAASFQDCQGLFFRPLLIRPEKVGRTMRAWSRFGEAHLVLGRLLDESNVAVIFYAARFHSIDKSGNFSHPQRLRAWTNSWNGPGRLF